MPNTCSVGFEKITPNGSLHLQTRLLSLRAIFNYFLLEHRRRSCLWRFFSRMFEQIYISIVNIIRRVPPVPLISRFYYWRHFSPQKREKKGLCIRCTYIISLYEKYNPSFDARNGKWISAKKVDMLRASCWKAVFRWEVEPCSLFTKLSNNVRPLIPCILNLAREALWLSV